MLFQTNFTSQLIYYGYMVKKLPLKTVLNFQLNQESGIVFVMLIVHKYQQII